MGGIGGRRNGRREEVLLGGGKSIGAAMCLATTRNLNIKELKT